MACPYTADISEKIIAHEKFVLRIPDGLDLKDAGPLLYAGITTWSPLHHWKAGEGTNVGVIGLGGLGHMALKLAKGISQMSRCLHVHLEKSRMRVT